MTSQRSKRNTGAAGNAMLYVLVGIILFAALSFAVTRINRSSTTTSLETAALYAREITAYAEKVNGAVQNVMLQNGCLASQISFENGTLGGYVNAAAPANKKCHIFDTAGGGLTYDRPVAGALDTAAAAASGFPAGGLVGDYFFTGHSCVDNAGTGDYTACASDALENEDLLFVLPWVSIEVCTAINTMLGNTTPILVDPDGSYDNTKFTGTYADGFEIGGAGFTTYATGCYRGTAGGTPGAGYHFYYTLLAR